MDGGGENLEVETRSFSLVCVGWLVGDVGTRVGRLFWVERQAGKGRKRVVSADEKVLRQRFGQHVCVVSI